MLLRCVLPVFLLFSLACAGTPEDEGDDEEADSEADADTDTDVDTDTDTDAVEGDCEADIAVTLPDGTETRLECVEYTLDATYEFDPDAPPEVRTLDLRLSGAASSGFQCYVDLSVSGVCGEQYYEVGSGATMTLAAWDCEGVADALEGEYPMALGYTELTTVTAGGESGDFTGMPVETVVEGRLLARSWDGFQIEGSFAVSDEVTGDDAEELTCSGTTDEPAFAGLLVGSGTIEYDYGVDSSDCALSYVLLPADEEVPSGCPSCDAMAVLDYEDVTGDCAESVIAAAEDNQVIPGVDIEGGKAWYYDQVELVWRDYEDLVEVTFSGDSLTLVSEIEIDDGVVVSTRTLRW